MPLFDLDKEPLKFGKYKGQTPNDIASEDPGYIVWAYENITPKICSKDLAQCCELDEADGPDEGDRVSAFK